MIFLSIKIVVMCSVYGKIGNKLNIFDILNLGLIKLFKDMSEYILYYSFMIVFNLDILKVMFFVLFKDIMMILFIFKIVECDFEIEFFKILKLLDIEF